MKFVDGSWCESNAALATVFLLDKSDTSKFFTT